VVTTVARILPRRLPGRAPAHALSFSSSWRRDRRFGSLHPIVDDRVDVHGPWPGVETDRGADLRRPPVSRGDDRAPASGDSPARGDLGMAPPRARPDSRGDAVPRRVGIPVLAGDRSRPAAIAGHRSGHSFEHQSRHGDSRRRRPESPGRLTRSAGGVGAASSGCSRRAARTADRAPLGRAATRCRPRPRRHRLGLGGRALGVRGPPYHWRAALGAPRYPHRPGGGDPLRGSVGGAGRPSSSMPGTDSITPLTSRASGTGRRGGEGPTTATSELVLRWP
jgi:hypothetical protein